MKVNFGIEILGNNPRVTAIYEKYEYQDGKRGARIGTTIEVLLPHAGFEKIRVAVPILSLPITQEEIEARNANFDPFPVRFEGFSATPYVDKLGNISYSAKADKVMFPGLKREGA